jgi:WXG100 family type VII secretion target
MRERANEFRREGDSVEQTISKMRRLIDTLKTEWEGQAAAGFEQQFETLRPSFDKMRELIADVATQLDGTAQAVEQLDSDIASKFRA